MKKSRITICSLLGIELAALFYTGSYAIFCAMLVSVFVLLIMGFYTLVSGRKLTGYIELAENGEKKTKISGRIGIKNQSRLPLFRAECKINCFNRLTGERKTEKLTFGIPGNKEEKISFSFETEYSGECVIQANILECIDPIGLFRRKVSFTLYGAIVILPQIYDVRENSNYTEKYNMESFRYSPEHGGDDTGETFEVREYVAGDSIKQVHWKLSARLNDLMVREPGYPITHSILVFLETGYIGKFPELGKLDQQVSDALSLVNSFISQGISCQFGFYDFVRKRVFLENIQDMENFWQAAVFAVCAGRSEGNVSGLREFLENSEDWQAGHYIYVTAGETAQEITLLQENAKVTVWNESEEK